MIRKDAEERTQHTLRQTDVKPFVEMDAEDVSTSLMQSSVDESHTAPSLMSNHSAYINVSQSDDDSQQMTSDRGSFATCRLFIILLHVEVVEFHMYFFSGNAEYCQFHIIRTAPIYIIELVARKPVISFDANAHV